MLKLLLILSLFFKKHNHVEFQFDKCEFPGCGAYCKCGAFKEYSTNKWFKNKEAAKVYLRKKDKVFAEQMQRTWDFARYITGMDTTFHPVKREYTDPQH